MKDSNLAKGYILKGTDYSYKIDGVLGQGSFGITYLATTTVQVVGKLGNLETEMKVAVKEFFMHEFCLRHADGTVTEMSEGSLVSGYARKFRKEAENLAKLSHPGIVRVLEVFEANNTCYYSMEYIDGGSLDAYVRQCGGLPEQEATECIRQIADALGYMHEHRMLHLDLKPLNVMRSADGSRLTLIDFGLSKQYSSDGNPESSTSIGLGTPGYAPIEQSKSDRDKEFAPTLDVYALGATFFKLLTGQTPPDASDVLNEGLPVERLEQKGVSQTSITVIERAMEPRKPKRVKSVVEFVSLLPSETDEETELTRPASGPVSEQPQAPEPAQRPQPVPRPDPNPRPTQEPAPQPSPKGKGFPKWLIGVLTGLMAVVAVVLFAIRIKLGGGIEPLVSTVGDTVQTASVAIQPSQPEKPAVIALESISMSKTSLAMDEGETATLTVKYSPSDAPDKTTTWKSSDPGIAKVSSTGKVTAVKSGSAAIIATCGGKDAYCNVTVKAKEVQPSRQETQTEPTYTPSEMYKIGEDYYYGRNGKPQDYSQAVVWYRKSADQGNAGAQCNLGYCYSHGQGVPQDYSQAVSWYRKSADQGNATAQKNLGYCYAHGQGVPQDYSQAVSWYRKSADQGNAQAQCNLGVCYETGQGTEKDMEKAAELYKKAARQGIKSAISNCERLGLIY